MQPPGGVNSPRPPDRQAVHFQGDGRRYLLVGCEKTFGIGAELTRHQKFSLAESCQRKV